MTPISRREFAESLAMAALVPLLGPTVAPLAPGWWEPGPPVPEAADPSELDALADALASAVRTQYGSRLSEGDLAAVRRQIRNALERAEQMRRVELANGDEPDVVFAPAGAPPR